jgi:hypothetical protein
MNRKKFIEEYTRFNRLALTLVAKVKQRGITSLKNEVWDLDGSVFKDGIILILDEADPAIINEILSNKIAFEKDKYSQLFKTLQKRAIMGIQSGERLSILYKILNSAAGLTLDEENKIDVLMLTDINETEAEIEAQEAGGEPNNESNPLFAKILSLDDTSIKIILQEVNFNVLSAAFKQSSEKVRERFYKYLSKREEAMLREGIEYEGSDGIEEAQQQLISFIEKIADYILSDNNVPHGFDKDEE